MKKGLFVSVLAVLIAGLFASQILADDNLVQFSGGIGVIPVSSGAGTAPTATTVNRNIVRGVNPPGQIWRISDLKAKVKSDGSITVDGRGLLLAGGNNIGTNASASVFATLSCDAASPFGLSSTNPAGVALAANGDFHIDDVLSPAPSAQCASPVLLIRNAGNLAWFAAGIPKTDKSDD
jgi:hypothetical protein